MPTSFEWKGATISANADLTIGDEEKIGMIVDKLPGVKFMRAYRFAEFMIGAEIQGTAPLTMVTEGDADEVVQASFEEWRKLPRKFWTEWWAIFGAKGETTKNE